MLFHEFRKCIISKTSTIEIVKSWSENLFVWQNLTLKVDIICKSKILETFILLLRMTWKSTTLLYKLKKKNFFYIKKLFLIKD